MIEDFQDLGRRFNNGLREFAEHPVRYGTRAAVDLTKDYWDLGISFAGGYLAFNNHILEGLAILLGGSIVGLLPDNEAERTDRFARNIFGGMSGMLIGSGDYPSIGLSGLTSFFSVYMDKCRRKERRARVNTS